MGPAPLERIAVNSTLVRVFVSAMRPLIFLLALLVACFSAYSAERGTVVLIIVSPGEPEFGSNFVRQAGLWQKACAQADYRQITIGLDADHRTNDYSVLRQTLAAEPKAGLAPLWLVLIGHGTFDGKEARFNLRGPDVSATELTEWLKPFRRPMAVVNTASASAPFINLLSGTNRVIITATRSGNEKNYARFGQFLAEAISDSQADLDKDGQVSLLEAFLMASRQTAEFYKTEGRLATEHALLDDNGDGLGTPADWFRGLRATKRAKDNASLDGLLAQQFCLMPSDSERSLPPEQRSRRDALERAVLLYRDQKAQVPENEYYRHLEKLLVELAHFYSSDSNAVVAPIHDRFESKTASPN